MNKIYCGKCIHYEYTEDYTDVHECKLKIDERLIKNAIEVKYINDCEVLNFNNDCKYYKEKQSLINMLFRN